MQITIALDIMLILIGFVLALLGIIGSVLPVIPGPPLSWLALLMLYLTDWFEMSATFLMVTGFIAFFIFALDFFIPSLGAKLFGGTKYGMFGSFIGLLIGFLLPIPLGILLGVFFGAYLGELYGNRYSTKKTLIKSAFGSLIGFITSSFLKFLLAVAYMGYFIKHLLKIKILNI